MHIVLNYYQTEISENKMQCSITVFYGLLPIGCYFYLKYQTENLKIQVFCPNIHYVSYVGYHFGTQYLQMPFTNQSQTELGLRLAT